MINELGFLIRCVEMNNKNLKFDEAILPAKKIADHEVSGNQKEKKIVQEYDPKAHCLLAENQQLLSLQSPQSPHPCQPSEFCAGGEERQNSF